MPRYEIHVVEKKNGKKKKKLKKFKPEIANILSNFEGWALPKLLIKKRSVFPNYFRLRTEGVLPAPASQSLIY